MEEEINEWIGRWKGKGYIKTLIEIANKYYDEIILDKAREEYENILRLTNNNNIDALLGLAYIEEEEEDIEAARILYFKVLQIDKNNTTSLLALGILYENEEEYQTAISLYLRLISITPNNGEIYYNIGSSFFNLGEYENAIYYFAKAIEIDSTDLEAIFFSGNTYFELHQYNEAFSRFQQVITNNPFDIRTLCSLALFYLYTAEYEKSIKLNKQIIEMKKENSSTYSTYYNITLSYIKLKNLEKANKNLMKGILLEEENDYGSRGYFALALLQYKNGDFISSLRSFKSCFDYLPIQPFFSYLVYYYYAMAMIKYNNSINKSANNIINKKKNNNNNNKKKNNNNNKKKKKRNDNIIKEKDWDCNEDFDNDFDIDTDDEEDNFENGVKEKRIIITFNLAIKENKNFSKAYYRKAKFIESNIGKKENLKSLYLYAVNLNPKNYPAHRLSEKKIIFIIEKVNSL